MTHPLPKILVVDDEEAILETMTFTFQDDYEVFTSSDARKALELLDAEAPFAVVLSDQRMPDMSGVEFFAEVCRRHPETVRMILTGFSDMDAIIEAINDGHVYSYITKPWEPERLKQVMKQAVEHHHLTVENERLLAGMQSANSFLGAVMDELDTGAIAIDSEGIVQAINRPVRNFLKIAEVPEGVRMQDIVSASANEAVLGAASKVRDDENLGYADVDVGEHRLRVTTRELVDGDQKIGSVILVREVSHEPLQRRFNELLGAVVSADGSLRRVLEHTRDQLLELAGRVEATSIESRGMGELAERISRTRTAVENWLEVDDAMSHIDFPEARMLQDRLRIALDRWPLRDEIPEAVLELSRRVEDYYESGEKSREGIL